jgi:hypothetical protein
MLDAVVLRVALASCPASRPFGSEPVAQYRGLGGPATLSPRELPATSHPYPGIGIEDEAGTEPARTFELEPLPGKRADSKHCRERNQPGT